MDVKALARRMTVDEKVHQLIPVTPGELMTGETGWYAYTTFAAAKARQALRLGIGHVTIALRPLGVRDGARVANEIQGTLAAHSRLRIPAIIHDECLHGCMARGATIFPQAIGLAATWDPALVERAAGTIGLETRSRGIQQALSPTINIARDPRCGRTDETYGEDPLLTSRMAVAFVRGIQAQGVAATPKHYATNFVGDGGRDSHATHYSERLLREVYLPAFRAAVEEAGAMSIMAAYGSMDGVPCSSDRRLLTDILRGEWGFDGIVVSDYWSVRGIHDLHRVARTPADAARLALEAGLDLELPDAVCFPHLAGLARRGAVSLKALNTAVERVLSLKDRLGLFADPYVSPERAESLNDCAAHRSLALEVAKKSMVLLANDGILPLIRSYRKIAVIGPNAAVARTGSYSGHGVRLVSPLEGIKARAGSRVDVSYAEGCGLKTGTPKGIAEAARAAAKADLAVLVLGNNAGMGDAVFTEGESGDRSCLDLPGRQEELVDAVVNANRNTVVVLVNGSAMTMERWHNKPRAILEAWYPGEEGGTAVAAVLFGDANPGGKLPLTFPVRTGQLPFYYNAKPTGRVWDYIDLRGRQEQFAFGHGLSYTTFGYAGLKASPVRGSARGLKVSVDVRNAGRRAGDEVVQLYVRDEYARLALPVKELKGFRRVSLLPGERRRVEFDVTERDLSFLDERLRPRFEPGAFEIMVGSSSADIRARTRIELK